MRLERHQARGWSDFRATHRRIWEGTVKRERAQAEQAQVAIRRRHLHPAGRTGQRAALGRAVIALALLALFPAWPASAQAQDAAGATLELAEPPAPTGPPLMLSLADALARARQNSPVFQAAVTAVKLAKEGRVQARAAMLPSFDYVMQYLNTQGNGISPVGRFVTNDGIHVYRAWLVSRQSMPASFFFAAETKNARYREALAEANQEIARRGLAQTVVHAYYALVVAERDYATAEQGLASARRFLDISEALERGGEVAHADVIRFQLAVDQQQRALEDAQLAMSTGRLNLAVLLFPTFNENFTVVDDLNTPSPLPSFRETAEMARSQNPEIRAAMAAYNESRENVAVARAAFFPSLGIDVDYGIEANALALHSINTTKPGVVQPNLGYFVTYSLDLPLFDWGARWSKLRGAKDERELAHLNLSFAQRQLLSQLYAFYNEAQVAWKQLGTLGHSVQLAERNLQLVTMQYQAGETSVLQVLDAETSLNAGRDAYAAGQARYRDALATLQTLTGSF
jgi:outer membrane protein